MKENLEAIYKSTGKITVFDVALEVAYSGESWRDICQQAEQITGAKPGVYRRLVARLGEGQTLNSLVRDALEKIIEAQQ
jgi:hypothetical protein